ncbi:Competence-specific gene regulator [Rhodospirillaceae bacterium LM-1]|nr:Competence-specific gene regulator [Rhodospirillaceae bacterium LM-1]
MASSAGFADYVCEQLEGLGRVQAKRMFGGFGLYLNSPMFALIADDELYLKADESNRETLLRLGGKPFKPFENKPMMMPYISVSADILDDAEALADLAKDALRAAAAAKQPARARPGTRRRV